MTPSHGVMGVHYRGSSMAYDPDLHLGTIADEQRCAHCHRGPEHGAVMIGMVPGRDGVPWYLCARDWVEGLRTKVEAKPVEDVPPTKRRSA